jgi:hypothetical protein
MASRGDRMRENEELFRMANDRLREQVEDAVPPERPVPFLCECDDTLCMERVDMTLRDYRHVRASDDTFAVAPGHAAPEGEVVLEERGAFQVVQKEAA